MTNSRAGWVSLPNALPLTTTIYSQNRLECQLYLDGVVTVVDSKNLPRHLAQRTGAGKRIEGDTAGGAGGRVDGSSEVPTSGAPEALMQVACADRIIMNKQDLISADEQDAIVGRVRAINGVAKLIPATKSVVDLDSILGIHSFDATSFRAVEAAARDLCAGDAAHVHSASCDHSAATGDGEEHTTHTHDSEVGTITARFDGCVSIDKVRIAASLLAYEANAGRARRS